MIPSPSVPRVLNQSLTLGDYDVINITLSAHGHVAVLSYDRLTDKAPTLTVTVGATTVTCQL